MLTPRKLKRLRELLMERLQGRASELLLNRLLRVADDLPPDGDDLHKGLNRIRVAVNLFVDEELADEIFAEATELVADR